MAEQHGRSAPRRVNAEPVARLQPRHRRLIAALTEARRHSGMTGANLASTCGWSQSKVAKIEKGRTRPTPDDVSAWSKSTGVSAEHRADMVEMSELVAAESLRWRDVNRDGFANKQNDRQDDEATAAEIAAYQPKLIPGMLQTPDYARHVLLQLGHSNPDTVDADVAARTERQNIVYDTSVQVNAVIVESVLRWRPGPPAVTLGQLDRLLTVASLPSVAIGIVPDATMEHSRTCHSFVLKHYDDAEVADVVQVETLTREQTLSSAEDVEQYRAMFAYQQSLACYGDEAAALIQRAQQYLRGL